MRCERRNMVPILKTILTLGIPLLFEVLGDKWRERKEKKRLAAEMAARSIAAGELVQAQRDAQAARLKD